MSSEDAQPRRFNTRQRATAYLAADGACANCGVRLEPGWHADHMQPYSKGGRTDVVNVQALCPTCNLKKGNGVTATNREWQQRAISQFFADPKRDYLVSATPGAGKTRFSLDLTRRLLDEGSGSRVVVVVPTDALRLQWADQASRCGLSLMPVGASEDYEKPGYDGCVLTYGQLAVGVGADLLRRSTRIPTIAILDEIHHAGDTRSWGNGLRYALENAVHRIALTGTPWRQDPSSPIPFVTYDADGKVVVDHAYEYGTAVADGVCRRIEFHAYDGEAQWKDCGKTSSAELGNGLSDDDVSAALDAVLHPDHSWMPALLKQATAALDELRTEVPDAGGLVVAHDTWRARRYAELLTDLTGQAPTVVISDDPDAKSNLDRYREGTSRWLVAIRMVSEGVDIPRLGVGVYATKIRTPLFFRQVVGRFVRVRPDEEFNARLYVPAIPDLMRHARDIEQELRHQLDLETERDNRVRSEIEGEQRSFDLREPLSASEAVFDRAILGGEETTPEEFARAQDECRRLGIPAQYAMNLLPLLRREGEPVFEVTVKPKAPVEPRHRRERMLRGEIDKLAGKVAHRTGIDKKEINADLLRADFPPRAKASIEDLEAMRAYLTRYLGDAS